MKRRKLVSLALALALALSLAVPVMATDAGDALPAKFDLRDLDLVSSVKDQAPFGTCWGFAAIAASEISILAELRELSPAYAEYFADPDNLDLSEHQLAWFAFTPVTEDEDPAQAGEGRTVYGDQYRMNAGGQALTATSVFAAGTGPIPEYASPYQNKEGVSKGGERDFYLLKKDDGTYYDWSVDQDLHFAYSIALTDTHILPSPASKDAEGNYAYDPAGTLAIKQELMARRGVTIFYYADTSRPEQINEDGHYIDLDHYAHYTYDGAEVNHAVCIVGWDDDYPKENFLEGHQPPADGAWIVKNSWGSVNSKPHHVNDWGVDGSGYFYLSYYDQSLNCPESFDFDVEHFYNGDDSYSVLKQYDYMPAAATIAIPLPAGSKYASVFTEEDTDQYVRAVSIKTPVEDCTAVVQVYLLNDGWKDPTDGTLLSSAAKTYPYAGFHRIDLDKDCYVPAGAPYSVVVGMTAADGSGQLPVSIAAGWGGEGEPAEGAYSTAVVNPGESFVYTGDGDAMAWADWTEITEMVSQIAASSEGELPENIIIVVDNPPVKAYGELARELEITTTVNNAEEAEGAGDVLHFTVTVKNPEDYEIKNIHLEDSLLDLGENALIQRLDAGESVSFDADYTVTEEDMKMGNLVQLTTASLEYDAHLYSSGGVILYLKDYMPWYGDAVADVGAYLASEWGKYFLPNEPVTRGDFVRNLYVLGGNEAEGLIVPFDDVAPDSDLADAVAWAAACGVAEGYGDGTFRANVPIDREQMAAFMYRYIQALDMGYTGDWMFPLDYPDANQVSGWADEAMHWMVQNGIIQGTPKGLEPKSGATMAQYCTVLDRFIRLFVQDGQ